MKEQKQQVRMDYVLDEYKSENMMMSEEIKMLKAYIRSLEEILEAKNSSEEN